MKREIMINMQCRIPLISDRVNLDELEDLRTRVRRLSDDPEFLVYLLGCEAEQLRSDIDLSMDVETKGLDDAVSHWP